MRALGRRSIGELIAISYLVLPLLGSVAYIAAAIIQVSEWTGPRDLSHVRILELWN